MSKQDYIDHVLNALPSWFSTVERSRENVTTFAELFQTVENHSDFWKSQGYILEAKVDGADWLNQHALDLGTRRQDGESNEELRARLRNFADAITPETIRQAAQDVVTAAGVSGQVYLMELRSNRAFFTIMTPQTGTGGQFTTSLNGDQAFTPDAGTLQLLKKYDGVVSHQLVISSANTPANDGTWAITGTEDNALVFENPSQVDEVDVGVTWTVNRVNWQGIALEGFRQSYFSRGYRMGADRTTIILILPYGCNASTAAAVEETVRRKKGAGIAVIVECRANP